MKHGENTLCTQFQSFEHKDSSDSFVARMITVCLRPDASSCSDRQTVPFGIGESAKDWFLGFTVLKKIKSYSSPPARFALVQICPSAAPPSRPAVSSSSRPLSPFLAALGSDTCQRAALSSRQRFLTSGFIGNKTKQNNKSSCNSNVKSQTSPLCSRELVFWIAVPGRPASEGQITEMRRANQICSPSRVASPAFCQRPPPPPPLRSLPPSARLRRTSRRTSAPPVRSRPCGGRSSVRCCTRGGT